VLEKAVDPRDKTTPRSRSVSGLAICRKTIATLQPCMNETPWKLVPACTTAGTPIRSGDWLGEKLTLKLK
jgi:hypothetical protein